MTDLTNLNTLKVPASAEKFVELNTIADLNQLDTKEPILFLGQGANVLFLTEKFPQVAKINLKGRQVISQDDKSVLVEVAAGELWHDLVTWAVDSNLSGIENMALIPGTVGAAAMGNIAAYNQNQEDLFDSLEAVELATGKQVHFSKDDMHFVYRDSALKKTDKFIITSIRYRLSKIPKFELSYFAANHQSIHSKLEQKFPGLSHYTSRHVYEAVIDMRTEKLPDWKTIPNAGSFFKNPLITKKKYLDIKSSVPDLQAYPAEKLIQTSNNDWLNSVENVKIPIARLVDELGWRGKKIGKVGTHANQALCIVNYGATGKEIYGFSEAIRADVKTNYDIDLEYEVRII